MHKYIYTSNNCLKFKEVKCLKLRNSYIEINLNSTSLADTNFSTNCFFLYPILTHVFFRDYTDNWFLIECSCRVEYV